MTNSVNVLLVLNTKKNIKRESICDLSSRLEKFGCRIFIFPDAQELFFASCPDSRVGIIEKHCQLRDIDVAFVLGGDGSIIEAASKTCEFGIPIVGINFGHIGYLAELETGELDLIDRVIRGDYEIDERMMLDAKIIRDKNEIKLPIHALNDIVLSNGPIARILTFDILCGGFKLQTCRADGVIIATPTGSTAYSMSAGGPILDPKLDSICITPICSHALNSRPVILTGDSIIELSNIVSVKNSVYLTVDGREAEMLIPGDRIVISRSKLKTKLIRLKNNGFLGVLKNKLSESDNT